MPETSSSQSNTGKISKGPGMILISSSPSMSTSSTLTSTTNSSMYELLNSMTEMPLIEQSGEEPPPKGPTTLSSLLGDPIKEVDQPQSEELTQEDIKEMNPETYWEAPDLYLSLRTLPKPLQERYGKSTLSQTFPRKTHTTREISPVGVPTLPMGQKSSGLNPKPPQEDLLTSVSGYIKSLSKSLIESTNGSGEKEEWPRKKGYWIEDHSFQWITGSPLRRDPGTYPLWSPVQPLITPGTRRLETDGIPPG
ncbi:uncharacterized protein EV420DRAFT_1488603 [Desarmillaria tabescens]|uniref:Uncharacterized protein n=1 Tax=Armillaria tabescens TaxID=1929756 RepID=A0AA39MIB8_ARMTA|nr:uncharacterized protein EV420DRAFT_1488603 [Desarmillaria tabescens]KAK0434525.1 hypothetical protein EV420DRAFT_1488603 [Desarmillaria tabescens]